MRLIINCDRNKKRSLWAREHGQSELLSWDLANKSDELLEASDVLDEEAVRLRLGVREDAEDLLSSVGRVDVGELAIGLARVDGQRAHFFAGNWSLSNQIGQHELESGDVSSWLNSALEVRDLLESVANEARGEGRN